MITIEVENESEHVRCLCIMADGVLLEVRRLSIRKPCRAPGLYLDEFERMVRGEIAAEITAG